MDMGRSDEADRTPGDVHDDAVMLAVTASARPGPMWAPGAPARDRRSDRRSQLGHNEPRDIRLFLHGRRPESERPVGDNNDVYLRHGTLFIHLDGHHIPVNTLIRAASSLHPEPAEIYAHAGTREPCPRCAGPRHQN